MFAKGSEDRENRPAPPVRRLVFLLGAALLAAAVTVSGCSREEEKTKAQSQPRSKEEIERIVRNYLLQNPEVLVESMRALEEKKEADRREKAKGAIGRRRAEIFHDPDSPVGGNPEGDVTIVEFFDYQCGFCRRVAPVVDKALERDPKLRIVYKEFPILGPNSSLAARAALASRGQGKYLPFHKALMRVEGALSESNLLRVAASVGLDTARLKEDMKSPDIEAAIKRNHALARALFIRGTPAFIIGDRLFPGALTESILQDMVKTARRK